MAFGAASLLSTLLSFVAVVRGVDIQFFMAHGCTAASLQGACNGQAADTCCDVAGAGFISDSALFRGQNLPIVGAVFTDPHGGAACAGTADDTGSDGAPFCVTATGAWAGMSGASWHRIALSEVSGEQATISDNHAHSKCVLPNVAYIGKQAFRIYEDGVPFNASKHLVSLVNARVPYERVPPYLLEYKVKSPVNFNEDL